MIAFLDSALDPELAYAGKYNYFFVAFSYLIACLAAYSAFVMAEDIASKYRWLAGGSVFMGCGVWAMHFIGMEAFVLPIQVGYDPTVTAISLVPAILASGAAIYFIGSPSGGVRQTLLPGVLIGAGIGAMHYIGMAATRMDAIMRYDPFYFILSIVVAVLFAVVALNTKFILASRLAGNLPGYAKTVIGPMIMGGAIAGMHYTAMVAVYFFPTAKTGGIGSALDHAALAVWAGIATAIILGLTIIAAIVDRNLKQAGKSTRIAEARLADALECVSDGFALFDENDRLVTFNSKFGAIFRDPPDAFGAGTRYEDIVRTRANREKIGETAEERECWIQNRVAFHQKADGTPLIRSLPDKRWVRVTEFRTRDGGIAGLRTDITDLKRREEALLESKGKIDAILENAADGIIIIDERGIIDSVNPAVENLFGNPARNLVGKNVSVLMAMPESVEHDDYLRRYLETGQGEILGVGPREVQARRADGAEFTIDLAISEAWFGEERMFIGIVRDITKRKERDAALRESHKLEAVGQLAGGVAHEFNNTLMGVIGNLDLLRNKVKDEETLTTLVERAQSAARRAANLTKDLVAFSSRQMLRPCIVDVNEIVSDTVDMLSAIGGENIRIDMVLAEDSKMAKLDPAQLEASLAKLALNARDAMPDGGVITLETTLASVPDNIASANGEAVLSSALAPGKYVEITVVDTGVGMAPDVLEQASEPFFTTKDVGEGTGLGLSTVHGFVRQSGGVVRIASTLGKGTRVSMFFPAAHLTLDKGREGWC